MNTRSFCEVYTKKILPVVRAYIACSLVKRYNVPQLRVAKMLGIKQPSVNYMVTGRRKIRCLELLDAIPMIKKMLDEYVAEIYKGGMFNPCIICDLINSDKSLVRSIFSYLGESNIIERHCIRGPLGG